jgi:trk system potassium uptake protein TrkH
MPKPTNPLSATLFLAYGFAGLIILGAGLLMLPVSSSSGQFTSPLTAFFSSASAVCITGMAVVDTGIYWSTFGQAVLLALFQVGGFGFIAAATMLLFTLSRKFGLKEKLAITEAMGTDRLGGSLGVVIKLAIFSVIVEGAGIIIFYYRWSAVSGAETSLWTAVFHSVSAFNNCGLDILGNFKSLADFQSDPVTLLTTAAMIIIGSTGYIIIADIFRSRRFVRLTLESKLFLITTGVLLVLGTLLYLIAESSNPQTLGPLSFPDKIAGAFFQAVVPRTAGFSSVDIGSLMPITLLCTMILMFIGGAAGSIAGGVKVNTFAILCLNMWSLIKGRTNVEAFGRQIDQHIVYRAMALFMAFLGLTVLITLALSITEDFSLIQVMFEAVAALSTAGLTTGITPYLSTAGQIIIILTMFLGRLGPLAFIALIAHRQQSEDIEYPHEAIRLG